MLDLQEGRPLFPGVPSEAGARCRPKRGGGADPADHLAGPGRLHPSEDARHASAHSTCGDSWGLCLQDLLPSFGQQRGPSDAAYEEWQASERREWREQELAIADLRLEVQTGRKRCEQEFAIADLLLELVE